MITVGLVRELFFLTQISRSSILTDIQFTEVGSRLRVSITPEGWLEVYFNDLKIWREDVMGDTSFFGVESCDTISRIIACLKNNDLEGAKSLMVCEFPLDCYSKQKAIS